MERRIRHPVTRGNKRAVDVDQRDANEPPPTFLDYIEMLIILSILVLALIAAHLYSEDQPSKIYWQGALLMFILELTLNLLVYFYNNWRSEVNRFAEWLSYIHSCLVEILNYIYLKMSTLDIRLAKYQNVDTYLEIFQVLSGIFHIVVYGISKSLVYNLVYVQFVVLGYQILKWVYYHIYPELVKILLDIIEYLTPAIKRFITRAIENFKWTMYITLVNLKIGYACVIYALKLIGAFWLPVVVTALVIMVCVMY